MKAKLIRSPNYVEYGVTSDCLLSQREASSVLGYIQLSCWPRWSHGKPQSTQAIAKITGCSPQLDRGVPLQEQHSHNSLNMKKLRGYLYRGLHSYVLVSLL